MALSTEIYMDEKEMMEKFVQYCKDSGGIAVEENPDDGSITFRPFTKEEQQKSKEEEEEKKEENLK